MSNDLKAQPGWLKRCPFIFSGNHHSSVGEPRCLRSAHPCAAVSGEGLAGREWRVPGTNSVIVVTLGAAKRSRLETEIIKAIIAPAIPDQVIGVFRNDLLLEPSRSQRGRCNRHSSGDRHIYCDIGVRPVKKGHHSAACRRLPPWQCCALRGRNQPVNHGEGDANAKSESVVHNFNVS